MNTDTKTRKGKAHPREEVVVDIFNYVDKTNHLDECETDLTLLTLKGHLVIENLLENILLRILRMPAMPDNLRLSFYQKWKLVAAAVCARNTDLETKLFESIGDLNKVRNDLAHNLMEPRLLESGLAKFNSNCFANCGKKGHRIKRSISQDFRYSLDCITRFLLKVRLSLYEQDR